MRPVPDYAGSHVRDTKAQSQLTALQQPAESPELRTARTRLNELLTVYTDQNPMVKSQQERIRVLEAREHGK
jgi:hypothetical protein